jgi:flagellar hook-basal body protein
MNHQVRMDVIGNNISNVNTVGYKGRRVTFEESFNQLIKGASRTESKAGGTNPMQVGLGVSVGSIDVMTGQGNLQNTGRIFDLAIEGNAFFGVSDGSGTYYTRNGAFQLDSEGYIILPTNGMVLQGRMADSFGNFPPGTAIGNLQIPMSQQAPAKETTQVNIGRNLDSEADAKGSVTYSQRMLHPADLARIAGTNTENDPGRETTTLSSLYNSKGQALNIKENDSLTISWYDKSSFTSGTPAFNELIVKVSEQKGPETALGQPTTVWTIDDFREAIRFAINHDQTGNPLTYEDPLIPKQLHDTNHDVIINEDGSFSIVYDPKMLSATAGNFDAQQIFNLQIKSSNPLSNSYVNKAFYFGSHIGPEVGNYTSNVDPNMVKTDALLRPAEQFDYMYRLRDANGNRLYPGLDAGDPIDLYGSVGKTSIEDGKSDPIKFYPQGAWDTSYSPPQPVFITDAISIREKTEYEKWVADVNKWVASTLNNTNLPLLSYAGGSYNAAFPAPNFYNPVNVPVTSASPFSDKELAYANYTISISGISKQDFEVLKTPFGAVSWNGTPGTETTLPSGINPSANGETTRIGTTGLIYTFNKDGSIKEISLNTVNKTKFSPEQIAEVKQLNDWATDVYTRTEAWLKKQNQSIVPPATPLPPFDDFAARVTAYLASNVEPPFSAAKPQLPNPSGKWPSGTMVTSGGSTPQPYHFDIQTGLVNGIGADTYFTGELKGATLLDDLLAKIRNDFKLPAEYIDRDGNHLLSVGMNPSGTDDGIPPGSIVIRGSKGKDFSINNLSVRGVNSNSDKVAPTFFNAAMGFTEKRKAEDVGVIDTVISVYDESGAEHVLTMTFVHTGRAGEWEWKASFAGKEDIIPGSGSGKVHFGQDGTVSAWIFDNGGSQLQVDPHNGSNMMYLNLNVGGPGDFRGITQFASPSTVSCIGQDGYTTGNLVEVTIDEYGLVEGTFSNGTNRKIAQIMMIDFANPGGLLDMSDSVYTTSANSGDAIWGLPVTQSSSKLKPGAVEMSNVDLSAEFTNMITTQRGYQANSRIITVSDSMLEELVNLKR